MDSLESLVNKAREGDDRAYETIVRRFQDMAVGFGYSILRDFQLAEDAAQEAFFEAYRHLDQLKDPTAFPGWFRRIVFKHCDRLIRNKSLAVASLDNALELASRTPNQTDLIQQREMSDKVLSAVGRLPDHERAATTLFYIAGYSQEEIGEFLDVPVTTIKKRLHSARKRLRVMLIDLVEDSLRERRPSRDEIFATRVIDILKAARSGDPERVKTLLESDPRLLAARDPLGNTALILAVNSGHHEIAELLLSSGVKPDIYEAASIGKTDLVAAHLEADASLIDAYSREGFTALSLAAHFGHLDTLRFLIERGGNINAISKHQMSVSPVHGALFGRRREAARILIEAGADVTAKRGGKGWPRCGWTALHYCADYGFIDLIQPLVDRGANINAIDDEGRTPLRVAIEAGRHDVEEVLLRLAAHL